MFVAALLGCASHEVISAVRRRVKRWFAVRRTARLFAELSKARARGLPITPTGTTVPWVLKRDDGHRRWWAN